MAENTTPAPPLNGLLDRLLDEAEATSADTPPATSDGGETSSPPTASGGFEGSPLGFLLQNPALLSALPSRMENLSPLLGSLSGTRGGVGNSPTATRPHAIDRHTALLCAIKPYLSPHRRETAETVIRLCKVWDALEKSGISLTGLLGSMGNAVPQHEGRDDGVQ